MRSEAQQKIDLLDKSTSEYQKKRLELENQLYKDISELRGKQVNEQIVAIQEEKRVKVLALAESNEELATQTRELESQLNEQVKEIRGQSLDQTIEQIQEIKQVELDAVTQQQKELVSRRTELEKKKQEEINKVKEEGFKKTITLDKKSQSEIEKSDEQTFNTRLNELKNFNKQKQSAITQQVIDQINAGDLEADADQVLKDRLLQQQRDYLEKKRQLEEEFGVSTDDTQSEIDQLKLDNLLARKKEQADKELEVDEQKYALAAQLAENAAGLIGSAFELQTQNRLRGLDKEGETLEKWRDRELELAGDNSDEKIRIERVYEQRKEALDKRRAKEEKKLAQKKMLIDFVLATAKAIASAPPPANIPVILAQEALKAAPAALLSSITFERGVLLDDRGKPFRYANHLSGQARRKGGVPQGASHRQGGIRLIERATGREIGEMEGGEPIMVLSKKTYRNNRQLVDHLLYNSLYRNGAPINLKLGKDEDPIDFYRFKNRKTQFFEDGGIFNAPITEPSTDVVENTRTDIDSALLIERLDLLTQAYKEGKVILVGEREFDLFNNGIDKMNRDRLERAG